MNHGLVFQTPLLVATGGRHPTHDHLFQVELSLPDNPLVRATSIADFVRNATEFVKSQERKLLSAHVEVEEVEVVVGDDRPRRERCFAYFRGVGTRTACQALIRFAESVSHGARHHEDDDGSPVTVTVKRKTVSE